MRLRISISAYIWVTNLAVYIVHVTSRDEPGWSDAVILFIGILSTVFPLLAPKRLIRFITNDIEIMSIAVDNLTLEMMHRIKTKMPKGILTSLRKILNNNGN